MSKKNYDTPIDIYADSFLFLSFPNLLKKIIAFLVKKLVSKRKGSLMDTIKSHTFADIDQVLIRKARFE